MDTARLEHLFESRAKDVLPTKVDGLGGQELGVQGAELLELMPHSPHGEMARKGNSFKALYE